MQPSRIELMQQTPIFGAIGEDALAFLLAPAPAPAPAPAVHITAGSYFFREGEPAQSMFMLEAGRSDALDGRKPDNVDLSRLNPPRAVPAPAPLPCSPTCRHARYPDRPSDP